MTTRETGTGLGLAIVQRIAEDHGGFITLEDRPEGAVGARLIFALPIAGHDVASLSEQTLSSEPVYIQHEDIL